jgi:hypothetical protein
MATLTGHVVFGFAAVVLELLVPPLALVDDVGELLDPHAARKMLATKGRRTAAVLGTPRLVEVRLIYGSSPLCRSPGQSKAARSDFRCFVHRVHTARIRHRAIGCDFEPPKWAV